MFNERTDLDLVVILDRIQSQQIANTVFLEIEVTEYMICQMSNGAVTRYVVKSVQCNLTITLNFIRNRKRGGEIRE